MRELRFLLLAGCDVAVLVHDADHTLIAFFGLLGVYIRIPYAWSRNDTGEHGRFGKRQILRVLAVIRFGGRLDAICVTSQINGVHVVAQYLALVLSLRDLDGEERFLELADIGRGFAQIIPFRILLGDGGTALSASGGQVVVERACDADGVDALIGVEGTILRCHNRIADVVGQIGAADDFAVLVRIAADRRGAVVVIHGRLFSQREFLRLGDFRGDIHVREQTDACQNKKSEEAEHAFEYEMPMLLVLFGCTMRSVFWSMGRLAEHLAMDTEGGACSRCRIRSTASARAF